MKTGPMKRGSRGWGHAGAFLAVLLSFGIAATGSGMVDLELERSTNLSDWESVPITEDSLTEDGKFRMPSGQDAHFYRLRIRSIEAESAPTPLPAGMVRVEGGTLSAVSALGELNVATFSMGRYPVTWGEWQEVSSWAAANGYDVGDVGAGCANDHPVHSVSWYDVVKWCNARSEKEGLAPVYTVNGSVYRTGQTTPGRTPGANGYRLPNEAEWEYAARGGVQSRGYTYSGSDNPDEVAWYSGNSSGAACNLSAGRGTWPVGGKMPNELGMYDMSGNVWEWCQGGSDSARRIRGGTWNDDASICAVFYWGEVAPSHRGSNFGFRLASGGADEKDGEEEEPPVDEDWAPDSIAGRVFFVEIEAGTDPFAGAGSYYFRPDAQGKYIVNEGTLIPPSNGTYTYTRTGQKTGTLQVNDSITGGSFTQEITFISPTTGTYTLTHALSSGFQSGRFTMD